MKFTIEQEAQIVAANITLSTLEAELDDAREANDGREPTTETGVDRTIRVLARAVNIIEGK